jgi:hypothetical protein
LKRVLPYLLLLLQAVLFFRHVLFLPGYVIPWDLRSLHLPYASFLADSLARGEFPLWDPYTYCGRPFFAAIQTAVLYPTFALAAWLSNFLGRGHLAYLLELNVVLHVWLAGIFTYLVGRRLGLRTPAALFGATVYELSGFFAAHSEHLGVLIGAAWMPLAWYAIVRWGQDRGRRSALLLAAVFALTVLAGNTPMAAFVIGFSLLFALLLDLLKAPPRTRFGMTAAAALFSIGLAAVQLVPTLELTNLSVAKYRADYLKEGVPPQVFVSLVLPNHYNTFDPPHYTGAADLSFMYLYIGMPGLAMAAAGLALARRQRLNLIFGILLAVSALALLGDTTAVTHAIYTALPRRILIALHAELASGPLTLALAMLGALAVESLLPRRWGWLAVAVAAADLILVSSGRPMNAMPYSESPAETEAVSRLRVLTGTSTPPDRIDTAGDSLDWVMQAPMTHLYTAGGADVMAPERLIQARLAFARGARWGSYYQVENPSSPVLGMMNVRYVLSRGPIANPGLLEEAGTLPGRNLYQNRAELPRFYLVSRIRPARSMAEAAAMLRAADFRPTEEAIVEGAPQLRVGGAPGQVPGQVEVSRYGFRDVELLVITPAPQLLASSETNFPGWRAWVDGKEQPIFDTNVAFRGLPVPAGSHTVVMRYEPASFLHGAASSGVAWLVWLLLWWLRPTLPPGGRPEPRERVEPAARPT